VSHSEELVKQSLNKQTQENIVSLLIIKNQNH